MKNRRFRLKHSSAPMNSARLKCNWLLCAHGIGLAGAGRCPGEWWNAGCLKFITDEDFLRTWKKESEKESNAGGL